MNRYRLTSRARDLIGAATLMAAFAVALILAGIVESWTP